MTYKTTKFEAESESGERYTVIERQKILSSTDIKGARYQALGQIDYALSDGRHINWVDDETFKILDTDEIIRKV